MVARRGDDDDDDDASRRSNTAAIRARAAGRKQHSISLSRAERERSTGRFPPFAPGMAAPAGGGGGGGVNTAAGDGGGTTGDIAPLHPRRVATRPVGGGEGSHATQHGLPPASIIEARASVRQRANVSMVSADTIAAPPIADATPNGVGASGTSPPSPQMRRKSTPHSGILESSRHGQCVNSGNGWVRRAYVSSFHFPPHVKVTRKTAAENPPPDRVTRRAKNPLRLHIKRSAEIVQRASKGLDAA